MRPRKVRQVLVSMFFGALIGAGLLVIAIIRSPHSHGEPSSYDIAWAESGGARGICQLFDEYGLTKQTVISVGGAVMKTAQVGGYDAAQIINYSVANYCPKYWSTLVAIGSGARQGSTVV